MVWYGMAGTLNGCALNLGHFSFRDFLKTYSGAVVQVLGVWPLGTHATCVKKIRGIFFDIFEN